MGNQIHLHLHHSPPPLQAHTLASDGTTTGDGGMGKRHEHGGEQRQQTESTSEADPEDDKTQSQTDRHHIAAATCGATGMRGSHVADAAHRALLLLRAAFVRVLLHVPWWRGHHHLIWDCVLDWHAQM